MITKYFQKVCIIIFLFTSFSFSQVDTYNEPPPSTSEELWLENGSSTHYAKVMLFPVSIVINGHSNTKRYALQASMPLRDLNNNSRIDYICGVRIDPPYGSGNKKYYYELSPGVTNSGYNYDNEDGPGVPYDALGIFGRGIYKVIYMWGNNYENIDTVLIEQDAGDNYDLSIMLVDDLSEYGGSQAIPGLTYKMWNINHWGEQKACNLTNNYIKMWDPYPYISTANRRPKEYGNAVYDNTYNPPAIFPLDCRQNCPQIVSSECDQNNPFADNFPLEYNEKHGVIPLNLTILRNNLSTPTTFYGYNFYEYAPSITVLSGATLTFGENINFNMNTYTDNIHGTEMIVKTDATLKMLNNSHINIYSKNKLSLECGCYVNCGSNIIIDVYQGGLFNNAGAHIIGGGNLTVIYHESLIHHHLFPSCIATDNFIFNDSMKVILTDGAILDIPDNTSLIFDGAGTSLQLDSNSSIVFGNNANIVFQNGAKIKAYHSKFTSTSSSTQWDGVYLKGCSNDTIQFCDIENAYSGLNILANLNNSLTSTTTSAVIVTNCNFKNTTSNQLLNGIYAINSNNFLFKDNYFSSTNISNAFANAITLDGCPSGALNIIGNNINNSSIGINVIQSSPLILRNTLNGLENTGDGIFLDNSNGSIKYNSINHFSTSIMAYYSNPYLLKNNLSNAYTSNLELYSNSVPILKPLNNASEQYWYSGNNSFSGNPGSGAIIFQEDSYPEIDSGFNKIGISTGAYLKGDLPSFLNGSLSATLNNWGSGAPETEKIQVQGNFYYDPYYDGSQLPTPESFETTDIGFNLLDTVYINNLGDSPGRDLFVEANQFELLGQYSSAITKYKNIIVNYKNDYIALASISRVFNCMDKAKSNNTEYSAHQDYLTQLKNNSLYPIAFRELCEDFIIKTKVRLGLIQDAISDYTSIYNANQNNAKGFHALLNKECLLARGIDTSDAPVSSFGNLSKHKIAVFGMLGVKTSNSLVSHNNIPDKYELSQNYPNPFNPSTVISYWLMKNSFVNLKVYDLLGREIKTLVNEFKQAGSYLVSFNGSEFASGVYFYRIQAGSFVQVKRMVMIK